VTFDFVMTEEAALLIVPISHHPALTLDKAYQLN